MSRVRGHSQGAAQPGEVLALLGGEGVPVRERPEEPLYAPAGDLYLWVRGRNVGGRFLSWGRVAVRMSDYDFKAASRDGFGQDWPISYDELVPYYEQVEEFLGIVGTSEGMANLPDGKYVKQAGLSRLERQLKEKVESTWPERHVIPWRYTVDEATPPDETGQYRTSSPLVAAQRTGRMELKPNAIAKQVDIDPNTGKATGVTYVDAITKQSHQVSANVVVICASTIEYDPPASELRVRQASRRGG